jgi:hypothetical protein
MASDALLIAPFDLLAEVARVRLRRAASARAYLDTISELGRLIDRLGDLHGDLEAEDGLHQTLHALTFTWLYVEQELLIVAGGRN